MAESAAKPEQFALEFERICKTILEAAGFTVSSNEDVGQWRFDFVMRRSGIGGSEESFLVDVKWIPARQVTLQVARNLATLHDASSVPRPFRPTLIFSAHIPEVGRAWLESDFDVEIWDRAKLRSMARGTLLTKLNELLDRGDKEYERNRGKPVKLERLQPKAPASRSAARIARGRHAEEEGVDAFDLAIASDPTERRENAGSLCKELLTVPRGDGPAYEKVVARVFAYIFPTDLLATPETKKTTDKYNIYDIIYRVRNPERKPFWIDLTRDMRARLLIVECKNYKAAIAGEQIFTTERYLSHAALRPIALIATRETAAKSAEEAVRGAMRENGKLMLILTDKDLCKMMSMRDLFVETQDPQNDPVEFLDGRLHAFLASLPR